MASDQDWLEELSKRTGASVEQSDLDRLAQTNAGDDRDRLMDAYESQYERRGASGQTGSGMDSDEATAAGYGSSRDERTDDIAGMHEGSSGWGTPDERREQGGGMQGWTGGGGGGSSSSFSSSTGMFPDWYKGMMEKQLERQTAMDAQNKDRGDALYGRLSGRADQGLAIDRNDPIIRAQADAFAANQRRAQRNDMSDLAERAGPLANIRGEQRMAAERYGAKTGEFEAQLMGRELTARRDEIAQALAQMGGMLSGDQQRALQAQLSQMDQAIKEAGVNLGFKSNDNDMQRALLANQLGWGNLGLEAENQYNQWNDPWSPYNPVNR